MPTSLLIVGAGHGAGQLVSSLVHRKAECRVTLVGEESFLPYQRPPLSKKFLAGEIDADRLLVRPESFYEAPGIATHTGTRIDGIDRNRKLAIAQDGREFSYDKLILALGARARTLDIPGSGLAGIHRLRSIADVVRIRAELGPGRRLTIVGAGYIGLEVAAVAIGLGLEVTVVERADRVMARAVSETVSSVYESVHREHGVSLILGATVRSFVGSEQVEAVELAGGERIESDVVIVGIGALPNTELADASGLETDDGIVVDSRCVTSDPDVYAIGDCTRHPNPLLERTVRLESVHNALEQAKTVAAILSGDDVTYEQVPWFWSDQYDLKLQIAGLSGDHDETVVRGSPDSRRFSCLYLKAGRLVAIDAVNSPMDFVQAKAIIADSRALDRSRVTDIEMPLKSLACD